MSNYSKVKEYVVATYAEAVHVATNLFSPYGGPDEGGSRTCEKAKVRIRRRRARDNKGESFRVVLFHHNSLLKPEPRPEPEADSDAETKPEPKRRPRGRRDRKGRKRRP
ncbi:MAG: hypothetical protein ACE5D3_07385 [Candidatus Binatia bacterium]